MQRLEVSGAVRQIYASLGFKGLNMLQRQKILTFIYPIYNHIWRNTSVIYIYIYITRLASKEIFSQSKKIHQEVGWAKDFSAPLYLYTYYSVPFLP